jgi:isopentenyl diphosphate isomerase/L-lactate dehydrogenase-like FMN-dependent dehydrogenase
MFNKEKIWTTLSAIVGFVLLALVLFGIITADEKNALKTAWDAVVAAIPGGDWTVVASLVLVLVQQIVLIFVKDPKPE